MEKLKENYDVIVSWRSYMLRPPGSPPISPAYQKRIEDARPQFDAMALEKYGLKINAGPFGIDSRPSLIGEKYAEAQGKGIEYHRVVQDAYWQQAQSIEDLKILESLAVSIGLDGTAFLAALKDPIYEEAMMADLVQAQEYGLRGVPALIFNKRYLVSGAQPYTVLENVVKKVQSEME